MSEEEGEKGRTGKSSYYSQFGCKNAKELETSNQFLESL